jgi:hypothetical protein
MKPVDALNALGRFLGALGSLSGLAMKDLFSCDSLTCVLLTRLSPRLFARLGSALSGLLTEHQLGFGRRELL